MALADAIRPWLQERQYAEAYHWSYQGNNLATYQLRTALVMELMGAGRLAAVGGEKRRLLDVGCGDAKFLGDVAGRFEAYGVDASERALSHARRLVPTGTFERASADRLPYEDGFFDVVTMLDVVEHLPDGAESRAIAEAKRVLKPGGRLVLSTNTDNSLVEWKHFRHYSLPRFRALFDGMEPPDVMGMIPYFPTLRLWMALPVVGDALKDRVRPCAPEEGQIVVGAATKR